MKRFNRAKLLILSLILGVATLPSIASANTNINAQATLLPFPTGVSTNFDSVTFSGYLTQSQLADGAFKKDEATVNTPTYNVVSNKNYSVYISAGELKTTLGTLTGKVLDTERLKVGVNNSENYVNVPYKDLLGLAGSKTEIDTGVQTTIDGVTKPIDFKLDLSQNTSYTDGNIFSGLLSNLDQSTNYSTTITISLTTL